MNSLAFNERVLDWFDRHGRKDLPWQQDKSPYRVWVSETMLQQTQVATVIPYFNAFMSRFPSVESLASADVDEVLQYWSGLGYYARARNLHQTALKIKERGGFPDSLEELHQLPGIGLSTAGAIMSIAYDRSYPILDGNVRRVLSRYQAIPGWSGKAKVSKRLWELSRVLTPEHRVADYTQAIMDLGATVCTRSRPACDVCPVSADCLAFMGGRVTDFPAPKPAKILPVKQRVFLLLANTRQQVFLEKRPPVGIWGGLWCLPEFETHEQAEAWCRDRDIAILDKDLMDNRRHTFSHYHLDYTPLVIVTDSSMSGIHEQGRADWHRLDSIDQLGLAAPIKQLLKHYQNYEDKYGKTG
ncbi:MAG: A/G-specific adenine glycosylase [Methylomicrobium sp.]